MGRRCFVFFLLLAFSCAHVASADAGRPSISPEFRISHYSGELRKRAEFWVTVYTQIDSDAGVIHDGQYPYIILEKIQGRHAERRAEIRKKHFCDLLSKLDEKVQTQAPLTAEEKRIVAAYAPIHEKGKFFAAAHFKRLRFQRGQRDAFLKGLRVSQRYLPAMEKIFTERGLPWEITRLPFVESSFNIKARSKVGASGIWQFMPSTAADYLNSDDERNDPILATAAAASLLAANYEALDDWPLAITAYNHGRKALLRATAKYGTTDLNELLSSYRSRSFGFASSNFFAELLAALESEKYFSQK